MCGLKILIFKNFRGNAIYGIDKKQYSFFEGVNDCASKVKIMIDDKSLDNYENKGLYEDESLIKLDDFLSELYRSSGYEFDGEYNSNNLMNNLNSFNNTLPKEMVLENSNDLKNNYSFLKFCKSKNIDIKYFEYILSYFLDLNLKFNEMLRKWKNIIPLYIWKKYRKKNQYKRLFK